MQHGYFLPLHQLFLPEGELDREIQAFIADRQNYSRALWMNPDLHHIYIDHSTHHRKTQANGSCSEIPTPWLKISAVLISTCKIYLGSHYRWMKSKSMTNSARGKFHWPHSGIISDEVNHTLNFILVPKSWLRHTCTIETSRQVRGIATLVSKHRLTSWRTMGFWRHWWKRGKSSYHEDVTEEVVDREDNEVDFLLSPWHTAFNQSSNKEINCNLYY